MNAKTTGTKTQATEAERERYTTSTVTSEDGTTIGYRQLGQGPGVVVLHGAASSGYNHLQLAGLLAQDFTVYLPDRRGRGLSGPSGKDYGIYKEVEDLEALLTLTGASNVFGVSAGAIITLQAALTLPIIHKAAIYEPPFFLNTPPANLARLLARYEQEMEQGKIAAAMVTGMKGAQMGPRIFSIMPRWLLVLLTNRLLKSEAKNGQGRFSNYLPLRELAATMHNDFQLVVTMNGQLESFRKVQTEVLLMGGSKSPAYLKTALDALERILPNARRVEFPGLNHAASWNTDVGGKPEPVAQVLRRFFADLPYSRAI